MAKALLGITRTAGLIEALTVDRALRRICGFSMCKKLPSEATFSRAFEEFSDARLPERVHAALIKTHLGDKLVGHWSRDGTAIVARERSQPRTAQQPAASSPAAPAKAKKRGRPRRGEPVRPAAKPSPLARQREQTFSQIIGEIPRHCDRGTQCNAQGYKLSWNGYKLHIDTADCGVAIAALLSSASMHDSRAAIPLSLLSADRVTNLYEVMDAAYCSRVLREHSVSLGHVPLIDHNPRGGVKLGFSPSEAIGYNERTVAERSNARLKDEFGGNAVMVKGATKVMSHLMFGRLCLSADQLMRLRLG